MTELIISYFLDDGAQLLGVERFEGIEEQLIPAFSEGGHKVSVTKFFRGFDDCRWLVKIIGGHPL
jgi:hypothetical protein